MQRNVWNPRLGPFFLYIAFLAVLGFATKWWLWAWIPLYVAQCSLVAWLLWRYRRLLPELNVRFHWLAIPTGVGLLYAWIGLGNLSEQYLTQLPGVGGWFAGPDEQHTLQKMGEVSAVAMAVALGLKFLGMSIVVPLFEELFSRSAILRGMSNARQTGLGLVQLITDVPAIGDWLMETRLGRYAQQQPNQFSQQFQATGLGQITLFGVIASTGIFMANHVPRDYLGCIACGVVWCLLLWWTNRGEKKLGLGPIIWSHGITNATLWAWTLIYNDWRFL